MLVVSVFFHLLFMTVVLFLPKPRFQEEILVPTFTVQVVELPPSQEAAGSRPRNLEQASSVPVSETAKPEPDQAASKPIARKPEPVEVKPPAPIPPSTEASRSPEVPNKVLEALNALENDEPGKKSLIQELDQLARLDAKIPAKKPTVDNGAIEEKIRNLDAVKNKALAPRKNKNAASPISENPLKDFDRLQMKKKEEIAPAPLKGEQDRDSLSVERMELDLLAKRKADEEKKVEDKSSAALLNELERLARLDSLQARKVVPRAQVPKAGEQPGVTRTPEPRPDLEKKAFNPILEKLAELERDTGKASLDITVKPLKAKDYQSELRRQESPRLGVPPLVEPGKEESVVFSEKAGPPQATLLSLYVGEIRKIIFSKWKTPLLSGDSETVAAFFIFAKGNIDKPVLEKSSGNEQLDTLALRAILDAEPYPPFPEDLKYSNLHITIRFKYVPQTQTSGP